MEDKLQVGVIASTHGVKGEVKVFPTTESASRFLELKNVSLDVGDGFLDLEITGVKFFKQFAILKFKGIDSINGIEKYKGRGLFIDRKEGLFLEEDEYYTADLIGIKVRTENGEDFGILREILETGANDVYVVETDRYGQVLLPAIRECILNVDIEEGVMIIHLMKGLVA